jgi:hypothetical protein
MSFLQQNMPAPLRIKIANYDTHHALACKALLSALDDTELVEVYQFDPAKRFGTDLLTYAVKGNDGIQECIEYRAIYITYTGHL